MNLHELRFFFIFLKIAVLLILPYTITSLLVAPIPDEPLNVCQPSPCGSNAVCKERNGAGSCSCLPEYYGDPYSGCKPECVLNSDCPKTKACVNNKCVDPCPGVCGLNAECNVINHSPSCSCIPGLTGDPLTACHEPPPSKNQNQNKSLKRNSFKLNTRLQFTKIPLMSVHPRHAVLIVSVEK